MSYNNLYSVLFVVFSALTRRTASSSLQFSQIGRNLSLSWEDPSLSSAEHFDARVSDLIAYDVLQFAQNVCQRMIEDEPTAKKYIFSPVSIMSVLSMLMVGAKGSTYKEFQRIFTLESDVELANNPAKFYTELGYLLEDLQSHESHQLLRSRANAAWRNTQPFFSFGRRNRYNEYLEHITKVANGIFTQAGYSLNPDYLYVMNSIYEATLESLDFAYKSAESKDFINSWVERKTFGKIKNLLQQNPTQEDRVIIASSLYFKGFWEYYFVHTSYDAFYPNGRHQEPLNVPMMFTIGTFPYYLSTEYGCEIIGLPYQDNLTTMYIIKPNDSTRVKVKELQRVLGAGQIEQLISKMVRLSASVALPRMHFVSRTDLKSIVARLGVKNIFDRNLSDLSLIGSLNNLRGNDVQPLASQSTLNKLHLDQLERERRSPSGNSGLFITEILHQVDIDIHETGTEAAAATAAFATKVGPPIAFRADAPFVFLIRHDPTKLILFFGMVNEPEI